MSTAKNNLDSQASAVIDYLNGTALSLEQGIIDTLGEEFLHLQDDEDFCTLIDNEIFICSRCDWWCEISEAAGDSYGEPYCYDCEE